MCRRVFRVSHKHPAPADPHTLSLHDALPILLRAPQYASRIAFAESTANLGLLILSVAVWYLRMLDWAAGPSVAVQHTKVPQDRKSTRLNSSHLGISYAVFCLKKKRQ